jgi:hypothetical protein
LATLEAIGASLSATTPLVDTSVTVSAIPQSSPQATINGRRPSPSAYPALISALKEKLAELAAADSEQFEREPAKQPLTGAERQRRYKKKKRPGHETGDENTCRGQETPSPGGVTGDRVSSLFPSPIGQ